MENRYFSNNATTTVTSLSGTTLVVASAAKFPSQYPYFLTLETAGLTREIVKVTASPSANTLTIVRAQEGTIQSTFSAGDKVEIRITAGTLNGLNDKAERSGDTFTGNVKVQTSGSVGSTTIRSGTNGTNGGQIHFADSADSSQMFLGGTSSGGFITAQTNTATAALSISVPTNTVSGDQFSLTTQSDGKTRLKIGNDFIPRCIPAGYPLPTTNIGPIWHDDYMDFMVWRDLAVGTSSEYHGYASVSLGTFRMDTAWRDGYIPITYTVSKTTYAALWAWAVEEGLTVPLVSQNPGDFRFAEVNATTFKLPNLGGFFPRIHDTSGNIDVNRTALSGQSYQMSQHAHLIYGQDNTASPSALSSNEVGNVESYDAVGAFFSRTSGLAGGTHNASETRPYNTAFYGMIKF